MHLLHGDKCRNASRVAAPQAPRALVPGHTAPGDLLPCLCQGEGQMFHFCISCLDSVIARHGTSTGDPTARQNYPYILSALQRGHGGTMEGQGLESCGNTGGIAELWSSSCTPERLQASVMWCVFLHSVCVNIHVCPESASSQHQEA